MARYESRNKATIDKAFNRFINREEAIITDGMYGLLNAGLEYLHEAHDMHRPGMYHETENDTIGWALIHNGKILEVVSQSKGEWTPHGDAVGRLQAIAAEVPLGAWVGIILSDMANNWYRVDYEMDFLGYSADEVREHFHEFFKPITQ